MKAKLKFDKKAILGFFANNGEKLLFAGVVLGFLFFVYRAVGRERFDKTPQDLAAEAENAARHIDQCDPKVATKGIDPGPLIEAVSAPIKGDPYEFITVLNPPPIPPLSKRGEPVLYTVEDLRATPGLGRFSDRAGMPGMGGMGMGGMAGMGAPRSGGRRDRRPRRHAAGRPGQALGRADRPGELREVHEIVLGVLQGRRHQVAPERRAAVRVLYRRTRGNHRPETGSQHAEVGDDRTKT